MPTAFSATEEPMDSQPPPTYNAVGTNITCTIFLIVNGILGVGILNFPKAFDEAGGIGVATTVHIIFLAFIVIGSLQLAYAADRCRSGPAETLHGLMEETTGRWGKMITSAIVVIYSFFVSVSQLIVIGDQLDMTFAALYGQDFYTKWYMNRSFTIPACSCLLILPMCYSRRIDFLRIPSTLGVIAIIYLLGVVIYKYYAGNFNFEPIETKPTHFIDAFLVVPNVFYGYEFHVMAIPIYSCMKHRTFKNIIHVELPICWNNEHRKYQKIPQSQKTRKL